MNPVLQNNQGTTGKPDSNMLSAFRQFKQSMQGDPKQKVMDMLNAGQIDKSTLDRAMSFAKMYGGMFK